MNTFRGSNPAIFMLPASKWGVSLTLLHSERPKLQTILAILSAIGLKERIRPKSRFFKCKFFSFKTNTFWNHRSCFLCGAPVAQWVKRWPTDLADRVRSTLEAKSSQP